MCGREKTSECVLDFSDANNLGQICCFLVAEGLPGGLELLEQREGRKWLQFETLLGIYEALKCFLPWGGIQPVALCVASGLVPGPDASSARATLHPHGGWISDSGSTFLEALRHFGSA